MSQAKKAVDEIQSLVKRFQPLFELSKALEQVGDYEQLAAEALEKKKVILADCEMAKAQLNSLCSEVELANSSFHEKTKEAVQLVESANAKAALIVKSAEAECNKMYSEFSKVKLAVQEDVKSSKVELASVKLAIQESEKALASLKNEFEYYKTKIASFLK